MKNKTLVLAIDTAISSGSFSLWKDGMEINSHIGGKTLSRSEDILQIVDKLLGDANYDKSDISKLLFTNGPGSYTGLRVGVSTILGLCFALNCSFQTYSVLEVLTSVSQTSGKLIVVVQSGREQVVYQEFTKDLIKIEKINNVKKLKMKEFNKMIQGISLDYIIGEKRLENQVYIQNDTEFKGASDNVSKLVYKYFIGIKDITKDNVLTLNYGGEYKS